MMMLRYKCTGVQVYDTFEEKEFCLAASQEDAKKIAGQLNKLFNDWDKVTSISVELSEQLKIAEERNYNIIKLIDIRVKENEQLALIHFSTPEDQYINEYESRADELMQLKKLIIEDNTQNE